MKVKVLKDSIRFEKYTYFPKQIIENFPEDEALRLKELGNVEILEEREKNPKDKSSKSKGSKGKDLENKEGE